MFADKVNKEVSVITELLWPICFKIVWSSESIQYNNVKITNLSLQNNYRVKAGEYSSKTWMDDLSGPLQKSFAELTLII